MVLSDLELVAKDLRESYPLLEYNFFYLKPTLNWLLLNNRLFNA